MKTASIKPAAVLLALSLLLGVTAARVVADDTPAQGFGTVTGTVMDKDGKPAAGVTVSLWAPVVKKSKDGTLGGDRPAKGSKTKAGKPLPTPISTATTGNDGGFTMSNVAAGQFMIDVGVKKDVVAGYDHKTVIVKDGQNSVVSLALKVPSTEQKPTK